jgi:hypothetical protein
MAFNLEVRGRQVSIPEEDTWVRDDGVRVVRAHRLEAIAREQGEVIPSPKLEFAIEVGGSLFVAYRCEGPDSQGRQISAVGEASPANCPSEVAGAYPVAMAFLRAKVRWITAALDLSGQVYADIEFADPGAGSGNVGDSQPASPGEYRVFFGKHKGKTVEEVFAEDPDYLLWIRDTYTPRDNRGKVLQEAVSEFLNLAYSS